MRAMPQILNDEHLYVMFSKCEFRLDSVSFFGHEVSKQGTMVEQKKIEMVWDRV